MKINSFHPLWLLLLLPFILAQDDEATTLRKPGASSGCAFYCFIQPYKWEEVNFTEYRNLPCSHYVYGYSKVGSNNLPEIPTVHDISSPGERNGNFEKLLRLKFDEDGDPSRDIKFLYGFDAEKLEFVQSSSQRKKIAKHLTSVAYQNQFNGIFVLLDHDTMFNDPTLHFIRNIKEELQMYKNLTKFSMDLIIGFPASRAPFAERRFANFDPYVDGFYLMGGEVPSMSDPNIAIGIDPIFPSADVPREDAISHNAGILTSSGISKSKIIIGLSAWTRSYYIPNERKTTAHNSLAAGPGKRGNRTHQLNGKLGYDEICHLVDDDELIVDRSSSVVSFINDKTWYSFNPPGHEAFLRKLNWISDNEFGGVGLFSLFADDKYSKCRRGTFPIHKYVGNNFKCRAPKEKRGNAVCTRMCGFDVEDSYEFNYKTFRPNWCSHIILSTANVEGTGGLAISPALKSAVRSFNRWKTDQKPYLIVSIGKRDTNDRWRMSIGNPHSRSLLIHNIKQFAMENDVDGIDIAWTLNKIDSAVDIRFFNNFLKELRNKLPHMLIIVTVTPLTTYNARYNVSTLNTTADFILLEGYRFHSYNNWFTGHHSPLFVSSQLLQDPKMTIEGFALDWISRGINSQKLVIGLTAEGMAMSFSSLKSDDRTIGQRANPASMRAMNGGKISQTEICEMKKNETTKVRFIDDLGVPYLFNGADFVAYDDERSIQIKSVWASFGFIRCNLTEEQFESVMGEKVKLVDSIRKYVNENGFRGVELKCDNLLKPSNKGKFDSFLKALKDNFDAKDSESPASCGKSISIRIPVWTSNLKDGYEVSTLNSLDHVILEPFQTSTGKSQLVSPLFGHADEDQLTIDSTIKAWTTGGLSRSSIVVSLPSYAILQKLTNNNRMHPGSEVQVDFIDIISQNQVCGKLSRPGTIRKPLYDFVATFATTASNEQVNFETQETVKYKLKYVLREGFGGIGIMTLNQDDYDNLCGQGTFPILKTLSDFKC
uniref:GH18 domain-containing protein n=1 Tax=Panagrolaimus sp. JU765 TaxID=591449 RepID=A0AC34R4Z7_9BILA